MQGKQLRKLEAELWKAADQLRANSKLTASQYSMPVLGLIFLRHAYNRFKKVETVVAETLPVHPTRGRRPLTKKDFVAQNSLFLPEKAQFDYLVNLPEGEAIGEAIDDAMLLIEDEYDTLKGVLPKNFSIFSEDLLRELLRIFNKEVLQQAEGDLFGKIYEFFLNKFAMTGAQEGGEFFTPMSLVQTIVNIIEPDHGIVLDPACGSAGMFVQTGYFIEERGDRTAEQVTFYGQEKAELNTKLAKMNLAVHGLEGDIQEGNTFYTDRHSLVGKADFVMANPPFNVDGVDKGKDAVKKDPRLMLDGKVQLPKNDNGNYLWIQYFYNYLKPTGRAGFVMASSASDAGHSEKDIRAKLVQTGAVDVMVAVGNNFFYTRSLPCTLWFYDRAKEQDAAKKDRTLMLDARKIFRKVTSKINDFSPEQAQNLISIVHLYRGSTQKLETTLQSYQQSATLAAQTAAADSATLQTGIKSIHTALLAFFTARLADDAAVQPTVQQLQQQIAAAEKLSTQQQTFITASQQPTPDLAALATQAKALRKPQDKLLKQLVELIRSAIKTHSLKKDQDWKALAIKTQLDDLKTLQQQLSGNPAEEEPGSLHAVHYFWQQMQWLQTRFPDGVYADVEGLCKVVSQADIEAKDWSLSPGRYVGVASTIDENFDYETRLQEVHLELTELNAEAVKLAKLIGENFKTLAI